MERKRLIPDPLPGETREERQQPDGSPIEWAPIVAAQRILDAATHSMRRIGLDPFQPEEVAERIRSTAVRHLVKKVLKELVRLAVKERIDVASLATYRETHGPPPREWFRERAEP